MRISSIGADWDFVGDIFTDQIITGPALANTNMLLEHGICRGSDFSCFGNQLVEHFDLNDRRGGECDTGELLQGH